MVARARLSKHYAVQRILMLIIKFKISSLSKQDGAHFKLLHTNRFHICILEPVSVPTKNIYYCVIKMTLLILVQYSTNLFYQIKSHFMLKTIAIITNNRLRGSIKNDKKHKYGAAPRFKNVQMNFCKYN